MSGVAIVQVPDSGSTDLVVSVSHLDGCVEVVLVGELDIATAPMLRARLGELIIDGHRDLRLNASGLLFLDAAGVGLLVETGQRLGELGGDLRLHGVHGLALRTLSICDLLEVLTDIGGGPEGGPSVVGHRDRRRGPGRAVGHHLPADSAADAARPLIARRHLHSVAADLPPEHLDPAVLATDELVTNAVIHGQPDITLEILLHPAALRVSVADTHPQLPPAVLRSPEPDRPGGRGLLIVNALATRWGITPLQPAGKSVWFVLALT